MPVDLAKEDEVWVALQAARQALLRSGHRPAYQPLDCYDCYVLGLLEAGIKAYRARAEALRVS